MGDSGIGMPRNLELGLSYQLLELPLVGKKKNGIMETEKLKWDILQHKYQWGAAAAAAAAEEDM